MFQVGHPGGHLVQLVGQLVGPSSRLNTQQPSQGGLRLHGLQVVGTGPGLFVDQHVPGVHRGPSPPRVGHAAPSCPASRSATTWPSGLTISSRSGRTDLARAAAWAVQALTAAREEPLEFFVC